MVSFLFFFSETFFSSSVIATRLAPDSFELCTVTDDFLAFGLSVCWLTADGGASSFLMGFLACSALKPGGGNDSDDEELDVDGSVA